MAALIGDLYSMNRQAATPINTNVPNLNQYFPQEEEEKEEEPQIGQQSSEPSDITLKEQEIADTKLNQVLETKRLWLGDDYQFNEIEAKTIKALALNSENPDDAVSRYIAASGVSSMTGMSVNYAYTNLDNISEYYTGHSFEAKDVGVWTKIKAGFERVELMSMKDEWMKLDIAGKTDEAAALEKKIKEKEAATADLLSALPTSAYDKIETAVLTNLGYIGVPTAKGIATSAAAGITMKSMLGAAVAAGSINPVAGAVISAVSIPILTYATLRGTAGLEMAKYQRGEDYWSYMHDNGDGPGNKTLAAALAGLNGIATMLIETLTDGVFSRGLNIAGKAMAKTGVDFTTNLGVQALVELGKKGTWSNLATGIVDWVTGALDEGFINELPEYVLGEVFNAIYRKANAIPDDKTWEDRKAEAWESIWEGIIVGAVYGTLEVPAAMKQNKALSMQLRREANSSMSWTEFVEKTNDIRPENIEQEVYDKAREQIYKASVEQKADVMKQAFSGAVYESESIAREELYSTVDSMGVEQSKVLPDGSVYRTESKELYSEVNQDSAGTYTVAYGDRNTGAVYGTVSVKTDGNVQTINGVRVRHGYENIRTEMVRDAIAQTRSTESDVQWNPTTPGLQSVKDTLVETNPRGKDYGLNFEAKAVGEDSDIKAMALEIRKNAPNLTEQEALVSARLQAITGSGFKVDSVDNISQEQLAGRTDRNFNAATSQAKSLIYLGQQSNVSSFTHELFHAVTSVRQNESAELSSAIRETLNDETRKAQFTSFINDHKEIWEKANDDSSVDEIVARFEQIAGNESTWSPKIEEDLARLWEAYVSSPNSVKNSIPGRIKILLQKLADLMKQVYRTLRNGVALDPEIARAYNKLMNLEEDNKAENTGNTAKSADTVMTQDSRKKLQDRVTGDRLLYAQDLIDEVKSVGGEVDENGYIHVFHRTSKEAADRIRSTNRMIAKEDGLFFSTKPDGQIVGYGDDVVDFWIPAERLLLDDIFSDEVHLRFPLSNRNIITTMMFQDNDGSTTVQKKNGSLVIVHSMSEGKLRGVIDVGGMPMPSLAITAPKAEVLEPTLNYGEVTFLGNSRMASRVIDEGAVWDRDIWSPTYPSPQYKVNVKGLEKKLATLQKGLLPNAKWGKVATTELWMDHQYDSPDMLYSKFRDPGSYPTIGMAYLKEKGVSVDVPVELQKDDTYSFKTLSKAREWLEDNDLTSNNYKSLIEYVDNELQDDANSFARKMLNKTSKGLFTLSPEESEELRNLKEMVKNDADLGFSNSFGTANSIVSAVHRTNGTNIDYNLLSKRINALVEDKSDYESWLERQFGPFYSEPMLKIGKTWKEYTIYNILEYMKKQGSIAYTMFGYADSGLSSLAAKNLKSRKAISDMEQYIKSDTEYLGLLNTAENVFVEAVNVIAKNNRENPFSAMNDIRNDAIAEYIKKGYKTPEQMKSLLWNEYAQSEEVVNAAYNYAELLKNPPRKYFEAKPKRIITVSDFDTAVVPVGLDEKTKQYLINQGLNVVEYEQGKQTEAVIEAAKNNPGLMFQDNGDLNPDAIIENMDSVEDQESMEAVSDDWIVEEVEVFNDPDSYSMELPEDYPADWDDLPVYEEEMDAVDKEQKLQAETPKTPSKYLKNTDNANMTFEQFAKENAPQVVYEGNEEQKDQQFREAIQDEANLRGYLGIIGEALLVDTPSVNAYYEQQFNKTYKRYQDVLMVVPFIDEKYRLGLQSRVSRQVNDADVRRAAKYSVEGKDFPSTTGLAKKVRKELSDNARFYRNILAPLIGDKSMLPDTLIEADTKLDLPGRSDMDLMAVSELADIASKYASQAVADKIMDGSLKFGTDEDERIYKEVRKTIKSQTDEIKGYEKQVKELEDSNAKLNEGLDRMQTALDERDNLLQDTFQILEELRTSILGDEKSSGRTQLDERYSTLWGELYNLNEEKEYQKKATAKGSRDKGKAIGASVGTALWMNDLKALYPQLFVSADGHGMVWQRGKSTKDNAEIRKNIDARREAVKAEMDSVRAEIAKGTVRGLMANSTKVSSALSSLKKAVEGISTILSKEEVEQWNSRISELEAQNRELSDSVKEITDSSNKDKKQLQGKVQRLQDRIKSIQDSKKKILDDQDTYARWMTAKQQNALENMARKVREEQREIYRKRIQGIRETNAIAIATARAKLFEARRKERQLRQIRMEKQKIANQIMKPVNLKTTDYDTSAKAIVAIQALIDPSFKREWVYDISKNPGQVADLKGYGTMTIDEAKAYFNGLDDVQRMDISQYLSPSLLDRLTGQKKPLNDWTISELKDLASQVQALRDKGKLVLSAKKEAETARDNAIRKAIVNAIQNRIKSKGKTLPGSIERQKEQEKFSVKLQSWLYATYRPQELAQLLDGGFGNHGAAYRLLIDDKRYHQNREWRAVEKRLNKVDPLLTDKVIDQLVDTVTIDLGRGYSRTFTVDELAYVYLAKNDDSNHDAVAYGALMDEYEKGTRIADVEDPLTGENIRQFLFQNPELIVDDNELEQVGRDRFKKVYEVAKQELEDRGLMDVVKAISDDFNDAGNKERLNRASIEAYNVPLDARDYYLSIRRIDSKGDAIIDDAVNGILDVGTNTVIANPEGGFMITRKVIRPRNQGNIDLSLIGNWRRAVADQEHLIENAAYVKQLRSVFASRTSKEVARAIDQAYGTSLRKEIVDYIELIANPNKSEPKTNFDKAVKAFRGRTGAAYLGWKTSGIILQAITSPMPGLSEINPAKLTAAYLQIGAHPIETINMINEKSIFMKKRTMDMIVDEAIQRRSQWNQNRFQKIMNKQEEIGQIGLTLVDRYAVAGNWLAMYNMTLQENLENGMDTAVAEAAAVQRADNFILRTQPVGDSTEMASMFRKGNELTKAVLQFQASLNVIWNNIVPDTIGFARNKEYGKIVGTMVGYAMAGVILGLVADGFDDDDDTKKKILKLSYWSITQQLSSVPLVSVSGIDGLVQKLITGKSEYSGVGVTIFPGVDKTVQAITAMSQGNWEKAASKAGEAAGIFLGAPTSAIKQYARAATGDWMALLGR